MKFLVNRTKTFIKFAFILWFVILVNLLTEHRPLFGAAFEEIGVGARGRGMAGAFTAVANDASAVYWNPAALSQLKKKEVVAFHQDMYGLGLLTYSFAAYIHPNVGKGSIGFGGIRMGTTGAVDFMNYAENTYIFAYGYRYNRKLSIGASLKYFAVEYDVRASSLGIDFGLNYVLLRKKIKFGLIYKNLNNPKLRWESLAVDELPPSLRCGLEIKIRRKYTLSIEGEYDQDGDFHPAFGLEGWFKNGIIGLRTGFSELDSHLIPAMGISFGYKKIRVDYTWESHYALGSNSLFGVSLIF